MDATSLENKVLVGYQGWFTCPADDTGRWTHWSRGAPTPETLTVDLYPDVTELEADERCEIPGMTIGGERPAYLFSSRNGKTVARHFRWMQEYGLDGALVQRFVGEIRGKRAGGEVVLRHVMRAAEETGRTFAIEYDISGGNAATFAQIIKDDWMYLVDELELAAHGRYQRHAGRPLVSIWGMGLNDSGHPPANAAEALALIEWFKNGAPEKYRATYMGGTPSRWRTLSNDARPEKEWEAAYAAMDVVQPWNVGRYSTMEAVDAWKERMIAPDVKKSAENGQLYMPVVFPGFSWHNLRQGQAPQNQIPRRRGEFLWRQAVNAKLADAEAVPELVM